MADPSIAYTALLLSPANGCDAASRTVRSKENKGYCAIQDAGNGRSSRLFIRLRLDRPPKDIARGYLFGSNRQWCDVFIPSNSVSEYHFWITFQKACGNMLLYNNSGRGTAVGRHFLAERGGCAVLDDNMTVMCGQVTFLVHFPHRGFYQATYEQNLREYRKQMLEFPPPLVLKAHSGRIQLRAQLGPYMDLEDIGSGHHGDVILFAHERTGDLFAAKKIRAGRESKSDLLHEVRTLKSLKHPNIVKLVDLLPLGNSIYLVMEHLGFGHLGEQDGLGPTCLLEAIRQTTHAIDYLHQRHIVHRDIKPANIGVRSRTPMLVKVIDFGFAKNIRSVKSQAGTTLFMAPEMFLGKDYGSEVDIWAIGLTALYLLNGLPGKEAAAFHRCQSSRNLHSYLSAIRTSILSGRALKFAIVLRMMLEEDPSRRGTARQSLAVMSELGTALPQDNGAYGMLELRAQQRRQLKQLEEVRQVELVPGQQQQQSRWKMIVTSTGKSWDSISPQPISINTSRQLV